MSYTLKTFKKFFEQIKNGDKTIDLIFLGGKYDQLKLEDEIKYKNLKNLVSVKVTGIMYFNDIESAINSVNSKNLISKSPIKAVEWYKKKFPELVKNKVMIISFELV